MEWDERWFRFYVDTRLDALLEVKNIKPGKGSFWQRGGFPLTAQNGSTEVVVENPYVNASANAPFDQPFYLTLSLAAGGTSGWFPDHVGNKPWLDESLTAMRDFAKAQSTWSQTWSDNVDEKSFVMSNAVDSFTTRTLAGSVDVPTFSEPWVLESLERLPLWSFTISDYVKMWEKC
ncbi:hypothetical protein NP233_g12521 [Leucocoprinus birnbaumii]|uniref:Uncharacterized protein n=1 Tax=Leucocoprinus birnbaumii TaxID=56174 RepID=A0AAD5YKD1_9AGAR|nr:hypothetical protein NP233_g12521 [Leucocoprinus birnbaumii]